MTKRYPSEALNLKSESSKDFQECITRNSHTAVGGNGNQFNQFGKQFALSTIIKDTVSHDLAIPLLGKYPMEICAHVNQKTGKESLRQLYS